VVVDFSQLTGTVVDGWSLENVVGKGADGIVYAARGRDGQCAAIKLFFPESLKKNGLNEAKERLELQLGLVGTKQHPHLVQVYGGGVLPEYDSLFLAMELVPGTSLDRLLGKIPIKRVPVLLSQLASAAKYLEEKLELFHRDIKPANIVISDDFSTLTLLDLGIVYQFPDDDGGRLSGPEFVATLRYSPPEFVWRTEDGSENGAWRSITFYQLGATLHDMLAGKPLFDGEDQPRARLYDCVRDKTPEIPSNGIEPWLTQLAQACLLKDWRLRLQFVSWESFNGPPAETGVTVRERSIRLKQARNEEARLAAAKNFSEVASTSREQSLWQLNSGVFGELRTYLLDSHIFPKFRAVENVVSEQEYNFRFEFDEDINKNFLYPWVVSVCVKVSPVAKEATELRLTAKRNDTILVEGIWTEMFTVDSAFANCQQTLLDAVDVLLS
jgi:eukaryotic-like serine/threonine-protein kinase